MKKIRTHKSLLQSLRESSKRRRICGKGGCKKAKKAAQVSEAIEDEASEDAELLLGDESVEDELADELDDDMLLGEKKCYSDDKRFKELVERFIPDDEENLDDEDTLDTLDDDGDEVEEIDLERRHHLRGEEDEDFEEEEDEEEERYVDIPRPRRRNIFARVPRVSRYDENFKRRVDRCKRLVREAKRVIRNREEGRRRITD